VGGAHRPAAARRLRSQTHHDTRGFDHEAHDEPGGHGYEARGGYGQALFRRHELTRVRAAVLREHGVTPRVEEFDAPRAAGGGQVVADVVAAGLNPVDITVASGQFYGGVPPLPSVVGREGIVRLEGEGLAYFDGTAAPYGSLAERVVVETDTLIELPEGLDPAHAVAFGIAGIAAWLALEWRAELQSGESVLVLGATGPVGQIAVQAARLLGAGRVVAAGRNPAGLERARELGADATVRLDGQKDLASTLHEAAGGEGPNVIVDPLWGEPAVAAMQAAAPRARHVQLGQSAGAEATIPSAVLRGKLLSVLGHANFGASAEVKRGAYTRMTRHAAAGELTADFETVSLADAADAWERQRAGPHLKLVVVP
jgi:NADPH2:quinone reductase